MKTFLKDYWRHFKGALSLPRILTPKYFDWRGLGREVRDAAISIVSALILIVIVLLYPISVIVIPFFCIASEQRSARFRAQYLARRDVMCASGGSGASEE